VRFAGAFAAAAFGAVAVGTEAKAEAVGWLLAGAGRVFAARDRAEVIGVTLAGLSAVLVPVVLVAVVVGLRVMVVPLLCWCAAVPAVVATGQTSWPAP
jgi:hypothetical protein